MSSNDVDERFGQVRQVAQRLVLDGAAFAITASQEVGAIDLVLIATGCGDDVSGTGAGGHESNHIAYAPDVKLFSDYNLTTKREPVSATFLRKDADLDTPRDYEVAGNFGLAGARAFPCTRS